MLKARELRTLGIDELKTKARDLEEEIFKLKIQKTFGSVKDIHAIVKKRRDLARIKTVIREKELEAKANGTAN